MDNPIKQRKLRTFEGVVESDKMDKTIVVKVVRYAWHSKYRKQYQVTKKFKVHDEKNECHVGDVVEFVETRPYSKEKRWRLVKKVTTV